MVVLNKEMYALKRFLHLNKGIVVPFSRRGTHETLQISNDTIHRALRDLSFKEYVTKIGNWQHAWYFVTEEGDKKLKEEVSLPNEGRAEEQQEIKN